MTSPSPPCPDGALPPPPGFIDPEGQVVTPLPGWARERETLARLYEWMTLTRTFDEKAIALQRTGRLGTYASVVGQEAVGVGTAMAMRAEDVFLPAFRDHAAQLVRGVTLTELFLYWGGSERGSDFEGPREDFPVSIPVASHIPHAVGVAFAFRHRREPRVAVCAFGDGATSKGDFYESINAAGLWKLPVVFVINNNQWAISVPRKAQTATATLAEKARAGGFEGIQVDGFDVVAVLEAARRCIERAREGGGPGLIEALTYRLGDHTTADDARRYRDDAEVSRYWPLEPIGRLRKHLAAFHGWSVEEEEALRERCRARVDEAAEAYLATPPEPPGAMFDFLYERLPAPLEPERMGLEALAAARAGGAPEGGPEHG